MNIYKLLQPNGHYINVYYKNKQSKMKILTEVFLPRWEEFCNDNWLNTKTIGIGMTAEDRVKKFLDSCAWFLLRSDTETLISEHKARVDKERFIPVSSCPRDISDYFYADGSTIGDPEGDSSFEVVLDSIDGETEGKPLPAPVPKPREMTRMEKINTVKDLYPECEIHFCRVDTEGVFYHNGKGYTVSDERYSPVQTNEGIYYTMDKVMAVVLKSGSIVFFTQSIEPIQMRDIKEA